MHAAIRFEPDGYLISGPRLMGRHAAGHGFLRAAVSGRHGEPLWAYTPNKAAADIFAQLVREMEPAVEPRWLPADRLDLLGQIGTLYLPSPGIGDVARLRLRAGPAAFSVCGVTHTTATHRVMDAVTGLLTEPVMPWDALVCTSQSVAETVQLLIEKEAQYLRWRLTASTPMLPQLPVIPLGVHIGDFMFTSGERAAARRELGIDEDEIVGLFLGRLSFHAKAHPYPMYIGLNAAALRTRRRITLLQCGWFANAAIQAAFRDGAARFCPAVRALFADGRDPKQRRQSWAAADFFISLSDNIQETFGLAPIEAMAAGLPVIVTDWDGYRDTVRDGVEGFRIPTWMPSPGFGEALARSYETGMINYDLYCGLTCQMVSLDLGAFAERLFELVTQPELRYRLGEAGRRRVRELFDWPVVYRQYQELWAELQAIRLAAQRDPDQQRLLQSAPRSAAGRIDPFLAFASYPTSPVEATTVVELARHADGPRYREVISDALFTYADGHLPAPDLVDALFAALREGPDTVDQLATRVGLGVGDSLRAVSVLAKMSLIKLHTDSDQIPS